MAVEAVKHEPPAPADETATRPDPGDGLAARFHLPSVALALLLLLAWAVAARRIGQPFLLPTPTAVGRSLITNLFTLELWANVWATVWRVTVGFLLALVFALAVGFTAGRWKAAQQVLNDVTTVLNSISVFVWIVLAVVWFGLSDAAPIFTTFMIVLPIMFATVLEGVLSVDRKLLDMGRVYRFGDRRSFVHITLPATVPYLVAGMKVSFAIALKVSVIAELFGVASGIGYQMNLARERLQTEEVFVWALVLVAIMLVVDRGLFGLLSRRVQAWR